MKRVVVLTGSELRHTFARIFLAASDGIEVAQCFCEGIEKSLAATVEADAVSSLRKKHVLARQQSEEDFFRSYVEAVSDRSRPRFLEKGAINSPDSTQRVIDLAPDLVVAYGCSIIREPLLQTFSGRFVNVHLGLSPYYRGSGTNFWPLVNGEPQYAGATFMHIAAGIDTGEIIHQIRARVAWGDTPSSIGSRLISDMVHACRDIILRFDDLERMPQLPVPDNTRFCKKKDFTEESVVALYRRFDRGLVAEHIEEESARCKNVPIIENPAIREAGL